MSIFSEYLKHAQLRVNHALEDYLYQQSSSFADSHEMLLQRLKNANDYSVSNGGKRLRPALVYACAEALGYSGTDADLDKVASAIECVHSYSLVHDDLPAMDDDDLRRGKPTCHIAYDEATAILVGDGLQALAFELLTHTEQLDAGIQVQLVQTLAQAAGNFGMVGGQMIDLESVNQVVTLEHLEKMHSLKTGALIRASVRMGALSANATAGQLQALDDYAKAIGLAFQVMDDILDIESDTSTLGKTQGADEKLNKPTYPALLGLDNAKAKANTLIEQAHQALDTIALNSEPLQQLADFIIHRKH